MSRYDDTDYLCKDLEKEKFLQEQIALENSYLEASIVKCEGYLKHQEGVALDGEGEDGQWKIRYENQKELNNYLRDQQNVLEELLAEMEWKYDQRYYPDAMNFNLDQLAKLELFRLVNHMERVKNDTHNAVVDTELLLEKERKEFRSLDELRRHLKSDISHYENGVVGWSPDQILERQVAYAPPRFYPSYLWLKSERRCTLANRLTRKKVEDKNGATETVTATATDDAATKEAT